MFDLLILLDTVAAISLSGVLVPGPVFAVTVAKEVDNKNAGAYIALGHGIVEVPIITFLYLGSAQLIRTGSVMDIVGVAGGVSRVYLGLDLWRSRRNEMKGGSKIERVPYWAESSRLPLILTSFYGGLPSGLHSY